MEQRTGEQKVRKETAGWKSGSGRGDRRRNWVDLCIILLTSGVVIAAYLAVMGGMSQSGSSGGSGGGAGEVSGGSLLLQTLLGALTEYGVFGLGITIVCAVRRESFRSFGLKWEKLGVTVLLSALACAPAFVSMLFRNEVHSYLLFQTVNFTKQVLEAGFPVSLVGMVIIAVSWGFFEGFSYVVIAERVNRLFPVRRVWLNAGAAAGGAICLVVHAVLGLAPETFVVGLCDFIIIYGMLAVRDYTGNAWGCVLIYFFFWNALV
ncbi:hypothetical protein [Eisenbergiella porci]|uniref:hypothetical protein n=1 Tax=Eisenbergiella porci TaxID=2652274 RepID=UPI0022DEB71C|nr:hypothetical protein [Eisenbergiella porci]